MRMKVQTGTKARGLKRFTSWLGQRFQGEKSRPQTAGFEMDAPTEDSPQESHMEDDPQFEPPKQLKAIYNFFLSHYQERLEILRAESEEIERGGSSQYAWKLTWELTTGLRCRRIVEEIMRLKRELKNCQMLLTDLDDPEALSDFKEEYFSRLRMKSMTSMPTIQNNTFANRSRGADTLESKNERVHGAPPFDSRDAASVDDCGRSSDSDGSEISKGPISDFSSLGDHQRREKCQHAQFGNRPSASGPSPSFRVEEIVGLRTASEPKARSRGMYPCIDTSPCPSIQWGSFDCRLADRLLNLRAGCPATSNNLPTPTRSAAKTECREEQQSIAMYPNMHQDAQAVKFPIGSATFAMETKLSSSANEATSGSESGYDEKPSSPTTPPTEALPLLPSTDDRGPLYSHCDEGTTQLVAAVVSSECGNGMRRAENVSPEPISPSDINGDCITEDVSADRDTESAELGQTVNIPECSMNPLIAESPLDSKSEICADLYKREGSSLYMPEKEGTILSPSGAVSDCDEGSISIFQKEETVSGMEECKGAADAKCAPEQDACEARDNEANRNTDGTGSNKSRADHQHAGPGSMAAPSISCFEILEDSQKSVEPQYMQKASSLALHSDNHASLGPAHDEEGNPASPWTNGSDETGTMTSTVVVQHLRDVEDMDSISLQKVHDNTMGEPEEHNNSNLVDGTDLSALALSMGGISNPTVLETRLKSEHKSTDSVDDEEVDEVHYSPKSSENVEMRQGKDGAVLRESGVQLKMCPEGKSGEEQQKPPCCSASVAHSTHQPSSTNPVTSVNGTGNPQQKSEANAGGVASRDVELVPELRQVARITNAGVSGFLGASDEVPSCLVHEQDSTSCSENGIDQPLHSRHGERADIEGEGDGAAAGTCAQDMSNLRLVGQENQTKGNESDHTCQTTRAGHRNDDSIDMNDEASPRQDDPKRHEDSCSTVFCRAAEEYACPTMPQRGFMGNYALGNDGEGALIEIKGPISGFTEEKREGGDTAPHGCQTIQDNGNHDIHDGSEIQAHASLQRSGESLTGATRAIREPDINASEGSTQEAERHAERISAGGGTDNIIGQFIDGIAKELEFQGADGPSVLKLSESHPSYQCENDGEHDEAFLRCPEKLMDK